MPCILSSGSAKGVFLFVSCFLELLITTCFNSILQNSLQARSVAYYLKEKPEIQSTEMGKGIVTVPNVKACDKNVTLKKK